VSAERVDAEGETRLVDAGDGESAPGPAAELLEVKTVENTLACVVAHGEAAILEDGKKRFGQGSGR
jgi:hypothetical protein